MGAAEKRVMVVGQCSYDCEPNSEAEPYAFCDSCDGPICCRWMARRSSGVENGIGDGVFCNECCEEAES